MRNALSRATGFDVSRETCERLDEFVALLLLENDQQNLISRSTVETVWQRHILDSAQLLRFGPAGGRWLDIGSGAGLPGIVLATLGVSGITLVEPRRLRTDFLQRCVDQLDLRNAEVICGKAESLSGQWDVITARAVASIPKLFALAAGMAHPGTTWILPKGRSGAKELAEAQASWQGRFRTEPSLTADDAAIVVAEGVKPKGRTRGRG